MDIHNPVYDYVFVSDPDSQASFLVEHSGRVRLWQEGEACALPEKRKEQILPCLFHIQDFLSGAIIRCWRDGWLPILDLQDRSGKCLSLLCCADELWVHGDEVSRSFPSGDKLPEEKWRSGVEKIAHHWQNWLQSGLVLPEIHPHLDAAWRSSLVQAKCAFQGRHPKYGVEKYAEYRADAFPPGMISLCDTLNLFKHHQEAQRIAEYYLQRFVRPDGSLDYYGPAMSEYGEILQLCAELADAPGGEEWLQQQLPQIRRMLFYLYDCFNAWMHPGSDSGLCYGSPEADTRDDRGVYLHNNMQISRGFLSMLPWLKKLSEPEMYMEAASISGLISRHLQRVLDDSRARFPFMPYRLEQNGSIISFTDSLDHAYANYRYYPEMLASGLLNAEDSLKIIVAREQLGGEHCGMTVLGWPGMRPCFDHWPLTHYGRALLELDERQRFMKILFSHLLYYQSPDTHTAYESITSEGSPRCARSDWCVPAQLTLPRLLAWSFSYRCWNGHRRNWQGPNQEEIQQFLGKNQS